MSEKIESFDDGWFFNHCPLWLFRRFIRLKNWFIITYWSLVCRLIKRQEDEQE